MSEKAQCYSRHLVSSACRLSGDRISKTARMNSKKYRTLAQLGAVLLAAAALVPFGALAQQRAPQGQPQAGPTVAAPKGGSAQREGAATADGALRQRVEQLEEQLVDIQVVIGTLESLARGAIRARIDGGRASGAGHHSCNWCRRCGTPRQYRDADPGSRSSTRESSGAGARPRQTRRIAISGGAGCERCGAGSAPRSSAWRWCTAARANRLRVSNSFARQCPQGRDRSRLGRITTGWRPWSASRFRTCQRQRRERRPQTTLRDCVWPSAAERLRRRRSWLRGVSAPLSERPDGGQRPVLVGRDSSSCAVNTRAAAGAFLKGYQTYGKSTKAPETLLKLAVSLQRLGQKNEACSAFNELSSKFPSAPASVKATAQTERQRAGCQ